MTEQNARNRADIEMTREVVETAIKFVAKTYKLSQGLHEGGINEQWKHAFELSVECRFYLAEVEPLVARLNVRRSYE